MLKTQRKVQLTDKSVAPAPPSQMTTSIPNLAQKKKDKWGWYLMKEVRYSVPMYLSKEYQQRV